MALFYYLSNRYEEAVPALKEAISMDQDHADAHYLLGLIYLKQGRYQES
jgi:tetratricopeptide (TPR) repeat protein